MLPSMAVNQSEMGRKAEESSLGLSDDYMTSMIMANDRWPMISYSCLIVVTMALSVLVMEICAVFKVKASAGFSLNEPPHPRQRRI